MLSAHANPDEVYRQSAISMHMSKFMKQVSRHKRDCVYIRFWVGGVFHRCWLESLRIKGSYRRLCETFIVITRNRSRNFPPTNTKRPDGTSIGVCRFGKCMQSYWLVTDWSRWAELYTREKPSICDDSIETYLQVDLFCARLLGETHKDKFDPRHQFEGLNPQHGQCRCHCCKIPWLPVALPHRHRLRR